MLISVLLVTAGIGYIMTPAERARAVRRVGRILLKLPNAAAHLRPERDELLEQMLRERTPWPIVTAIIVGANLALYAWMRMDEGVSLPEMLGNFGPRTTNDEWWRLATAMFVHDRAVLLALNMAALVQVGRVLERLVGPLAFAAVFVAAGVFANLVSLSTSQATVSIGASGAVFGLYGLLVASWMWGACQHAQLAIRLRTVKALAPLAFVFSVVHLATAGDAAASQCMGLAIGFAGGVFMTRPVRARVPSVRRVATVAAACAYVAIVASVSLQGMSDVRPALARAVAVEARTAAAYDAALERFRTGRMDRRELAQVIDREILGELQVVRFELQALSRPPREHLPLVQAAEIYTLRRTESWKLRSRALRSADWRQLRNADLVERAALERLARIR